MNAEALLAAASGPSGGAVIDEKLLRDCIYIEGNVRPGLSEDAQHGKSSSGPGGFSVSGRKGASRSAAAALHSGTQNAAPTRVMELHEVTSLMLSYRKISNISNLVGVDKLVKLHLDNNNIEEIKELSHLRHLKWLDLSFNRIKEIKGLEGLTQLEDLSLYSNRITAVQGLDDQMKSLQCLSLGQNLVPTDALDDVAKYLHRFKNLRMLTLAGNKFEQQSAYRPKILAFVSTLRFLDSRAVFPSEIAKMKEDLRETVGQWDDNDRREEDAIAAAKQAADEAAHFEACNCPDDKRFPAELFGAEHEGRNVSGLFEVDIIKDRVKEPLEKYHADMAQAAKSLAEKMMQILEAKRADSDDYNLTLSRAKTASDEAGKAAICQYEKAMKTVVPRGIRARPDDNYDEGKVQDLRKRLSNLKSVLLELEADQQDAYENLNKVFEEWMDKHTKEATETLQTFMEEFRTIERNMGTRILRELETYFDDAAKARLDNQGGGAEFEGKDKHPLLDNREECLKTVQEWQDLHLRKIEERDEHHKKVEEETHRQMLERNKRDEHKRNRWRVCEIAAYIKRQHEILNRWEAYADGA